MVSCGEHGRKRGRGACSRGDCHGSFSSRKSCFRARIRPPCLCRPGCDLNDAPAGIPIDEQKDNTRDLPCATGVIDLKAFLGALVKIGYDGPVRAEPFKADLRRLSAEEAVDRTAKAMKRAIELLH